MNQSHSEPTSHELRTDFAPADLTCWARRLIHRRAELPTPAAPSRVIVVLYHSGQDIFESQLVAGLLGLTALSMKVGEISARF